MYCDKYKNRKLIIILYVWNLLKMTSKKKNLLKNYENAHVQFNVNNMEIVVIVKPLI